MTSEIVQWFKTSIPGIIILGALAFFWKKENPMRSILSALLIAFVFVVSPASAQKRNITEKDLFGFNWIADPQISPDGSRIAFVRVTVNDKKDGYNTSLWTVSGATGETHQLTSGTRDSSPRWSPDGKYLVFVRVTEKDGKPDLPQLFMLAMAEQTKFTERSIRLSPVSAFQFVHYFPETKNHTQDAMKAELVFAAFAGTMVDTTTSGIRDETAFNAARVVGKPELSANAQALTQAIEESFAASAEIRKLLNERYVKTWEHIGPEIEDQLRHLFQPGFLRDLPMAQLLHFPRYLKAIVVRLNKAKGGTMERDLEHSKAIRPLWQSALTMQDWQEPKAAEYRWMIEELRVSLFAQELRTPMPVSVKRVTKAWEELDR